MGMKAGRTSSLRRCSSRGLSMLVSLLKKPFAAALRLDVRHRAGEKDLGLAFQNVERGRAEFAFAADDLAGAVVALDDRLLIQFQECAGDILEDRQMQQFVGIENRRRAQARCRRRACW